jgi:hypothetical protein
MTQQEHIERSLRMLIGELQVQVLVAQARIAELQEEAERRGLDTAEPDPDIKQPHKTNGKTHDGAAP